MWHQLIFDTKFHAFPVLSCYDSMSSNRNEAAANFASKAEAIKPYSHIRGLTNYGFFELELNIK